MIMLQVLIIEDDKDTAGFFKTVLELVGFECEIILSAKEALSTLAVSAPDLILLDIRLGVEISGEDILYQIRSNPRFDKTRVVIITGYPRLADGLAERSGGIDAFVADLVEPAKTTALEKLGEGEQAQRIAMGWLRQKFQVGATTPAET